MLEIHRRFAIVLVLLAIGASIQSSAQSPDLRSLFPKRAPVTTEGAEGLARVELSAEVLAECRRDLSDLRLLDGGGEQIPYLLDDGSTRLGDSPLELRRRRAARVLDLFRDRLRDPQSGPRALEPRVERWVERYVLESPPADDAPSQSASWELVVETRRRNFVRLLAVAAVDAQGRREPLIESSSIFRLRDPAAERLRVVLPPLSTDRIEITLDGEDGSYLEPTFAFESATGLRRLGEARFDLEVRSQQTVDGTTRLEVGRPPGLVPGVIEIRTSTPLFRRRVEVKDSGGVAHGQTIGLGELFRLDADVLIEELRIEVSPARGATLEVYIEDGDSPPLEAIEVSAILAQPSLVFAATEEELTLYYGGARAHRPRYDIATLFERPTSGPRVEGVVDVAARLLDQATNARLGEPEPNPLYDQSPPLAFALRAGAQIDRRLYSHRRPFGAQPSKEGLSSLTLDLDELARARGDLADVRIVDGDSHQWAYLFSEEKKEIEQQLEVHRESDDGWSVYQIELPTTPVSISSLILQTDVPFFDRAYRIEATTAPDDRELQLATGRLVRAAPSRTSQEISIRGQRVSQLELHIEDGNDQPLEFTSITGTFPAPTLYFVAPAGDYELLVGYPDDREPKYELSRARDIVLALPANPVSEEPLESNPEFRRSARAGTVKGAQRVLLWGAILLAVVVLTGLTLRLSRSGLD